MEDKIMKIYNVVLFLLLLFACASTQNQNSIVQVQKDPIVETAQNIVQQFEVTLKSESGYQIAVIEFTDYNNRVTDLGVSLANQLIDVMFKSGYQIVERIDMSKVLSEPQLGQTGYIDEKSAARIGKFFGASAVVFGSIEKGQGRYRVSSRIVKTETGEVLASATGYLTTTNEVIALNNRIRLTLDPHPISPVYKSNSNLLINGDFSQSLDIGWQRRMDKIQGGATKVQQTFINSLGVNGLYLHHQGKNKVEFSQEIEVAGTDLIFEATFQMKSWEGMFIGFSGTGTTFISVVYLDAKNHAIGATHLFNSVKNIFTNSPLVGVPRGPEDTNQVHNIRIPSEKLFQNYQLDIQREITNNLLSVQSNQIRKIQIKFGVMANDPKAGSELYLANLSLKYK
ncbi:MAG: hypothetical protein JXB49_13725 [Bacteroidales bacterium]|nr:hypothetical protein [Bacteroidales bacterium]